MDILDYIHWRGDVPFSLSPFNVVDALILSQLSYLNFENLGVDTFNTPVPLHTVAERFTSSTDYTKRSDMGLLINEKTPELLTRAGNSLRFGSIGVCGFKTVLHYGTGDHDEQFAAVTFTIKDILGKSILFVAYRGTDDTVVGWKEDFDLAFMSPVPAQSDAVAYLQSVADAFTDVSLLIGGHSKGGNLSLYAATKIAKDVKKRIKTIYNFDGPGLIADLTRTSDYKAMIDSMVSYYPKCSVVGVLFEHTKHYYVVESNEFGVMQHDPFSWHVEPQAFTFVADFEDASKFIDKTVNRWLASISKEEREQFVTVLFSVLESTGAKTNSELSKNWFESSGAIIKAVSKLSPEAKKATKQIVDALIKQGLDTIGESIKLLGNR